MPLQIEVSREAIAEFPVFGSALRDDFTADSDVDVLVWFEPGAHVGLIRLGGIERELANMLGRTVDMHTPGMLSRYFRDRVLSEAEVLYDAT